MRRGRLVAVAVILTACGASLPEGDEDRVRELRSLVQEACDQYAFGMNTLMDPQISMFAASDFVEAAETGDAAYDLMFQIRHSRNEAGYTDSGDLLQGFPAFGAFSRLADLLLGGPSEFVGYEVLFAQAVADADDACDSAFGVVEAAADTR